MKHRNAFWFIPKGLLIVVFFFSCHSSLLAQCAGFPATTADGNCGTGNQLANGANINSGDSYYFCGASLANVSYTGINLAGGILRICGNASISGNFNSGIIVVACGSTVNFPSGLFMNGNVGIVNYGIINVTGDITFQNGGNYVYNETANSRLFVSANISYPANNGTNAYLKNSGYIKVNGNFYAYEGGFTCFNSGATMEVNNILYNQNCGGPANRFTFGSASGTAILRYITHSALKASFTTAANWNIYQATGSTQTLTCGGGWGSATVTASAPALTAPSGSQSCATLNCFTLPTTLLSFTGTKQADRIALYWTTAGEGKTGSYMPEHSANGISWSPLPSASTANGTHYTQYDDNPWKGNNYYRLKQTSADGKTGYSQVIIVANASRDNELQVYPNPAQAGKPIYINFYAAENQTAGLSLADVFGRIVLSKTIHLSAGNNELAFDITDGLYIATLRLPSDKVFTKTVLVVK